MKIPKAPKTPKVLEYHNDKRIDDYYWLNEKENPKVLKYLEEENAYFELETQHTKAFQEKLFKEMKARIKEDDESVPFKKNGYIYTTKFKKGKQYPLYYRKKDQPKASKELLLDVNKMAENYDYYSLKGLSVSLDNKYLTFGVDTVSRRQYTLFVKNLESGEILKNSIKNKIGRAHV